MRWIKLLLLWSGSLLVFGEDRQLTHTARNHALDNNDNFSADDGFLVFDTLGSGQAIGTVDVRTREESVL